MNKKDYLIMGIVIFAWLIIGVSYITPDLDSPQRDFKAALEKNRLNAEQNIETTEINALVDTNNQEQSPTQDQEENNEVENKPIENEQNTETYNEPVQKNEETPNYTEPTQTYTETIQEPVQETTNIEETVWIGETGTKYHRYSCRTLKGNKYEITLQEAINQGRDACKVCKP